jgi:hypothetical protein
MGTLNPVNLPMRNAGGCGASAVSRGAGLRPGEGRNFRRYRVKYLDIISYYGLYAYHQSPEPDKHMKIADIPLAWQRTLMLPLVKLLFDAAGEDVNNAWQHALDLVRGFSPATELEFRLIVRMAVLNIQANLATEIAGQTNARISQVIRLQANALALARAADKAEARLKQLQSARIQRAQDQEAAQEAAPEPTPAPTAQPTPATPQEAPKTQTAKDEAQAINNYARKHKMSYAQAWGLHQREKKAELAQPTSA